MTYKQAEVQRSGGSGCVGWGDGEWGGHLEQTPLFVRILNIGTALDVT